MKALIQRMKSLRNGRGSSRLALKRCDVLSESVDTAVGFHHCHSKLIEPTPEVDTASDDVDENQNRARGPAYEEPTAYHQCCDKCVASGRVYYRISIESRLKHKLYAITIIRL